MLARAVNEQRWKSVRGRELAPHTGRISNSRGIDPRVIEPSQPICYLEHRAEFAAASRLGTQCGPISNCKEGVAVLLPIENVVSLGHLIRAHHFDILNQVLSVF